MPIPECGCRVWLGGLKQNGYGQINIARGKTACAHRVSYELTYGPVPNGMELDHLCRVRSCINPAHLEPVAPAENYRRGKCGVLFEQPTHCRKGHKFGPENPPLGKSRCAICRQEIVKKWNDIQNGEKLKFWGFKERSARSRISAAIRWGNPINPDDLAIIGKT